MKHWFINDNIGLATEWRGWGGAADSMGPIIGCGVIRYPAPSGMPEALSALTRLMILNYYNTSCNDAFAYHHASSR